MEELIKLAGGFWDRLEEIIQEGSQEREVFRCFFLRGRRELKLVSTSWQMKNRDTEREQERKITFLEIDNLLETL